MGASTSSEGRVEAMWEGLGRTGDLLVIGWWWVLLNLAGVTRVRGRRGDEWWLESWNRKVVALLVVVMAERADRGRRMGESLAEAAK